MGLPRGFSGGHNQKNMSKIINRGYYLAGERRKVGTYVVTVLLENLSGVYRASGATVPADSDAGFAPGCVFTLSTGGSVGGTVYINEGTKASADFNAVVGGGGGGGGSPIGLETAYDNGRTINVDTGAIVFNDATSGSANILEFNKTAAGSGNVLDFDFSAAFTGSVFNLDMGSAIAANGLVIDSEGQARTGADILITDDSTGAHSIMDINKSGAGATVGIDYQESFNGSSASFVIKATLDNADGLDTTILQAVRGTGQRDIPVIDINDASTGTTAIVDIDLSGVYTGNIIDIATSGATTGNFIFMNLDTSVAATAIHIEGSGVRTQPMVEMNTDATGSASLFTSVVTGAISGHVFEISLDTTSTGDVLNVDMNAAVGGRYLFLDAGAGTRTANLIDVTFDGNGNTDLFEIAHSNTGSGHLFDINVSGTGSGNVIDIVYSAASTGDAINIDLTSALAGGALVLTAAGTRTQDIVQIEDTSAGATHVFDINIGSTSSGNVFDVVVGASAFTGDVLSVNLGTTATAASAIVLVGGAVARTVPIVKITDSGTNSGGIMFDLNRDGVNAAIVFDIDDTAATTGNIFDYATSAASTGTVLEINMTNAVGAKLANYTLAGTRTANGITIAHSAAGAVDVYQIDDSGTSSGHVFDINSSGNSTGNVIDIVASASKVAGHLVHLDLGTDLAGNAILIDAAGTRTAPIIKIANTGADGGTDDHVLFIEQTGILDSNLVQLTFGTAASTGEALSIVMDTNVAGRAIAISSAATGTSGEGAALDITHTGDLGAGASVVDIISTGSPSSTSHVMSLQQTTGAGNAGSYVLYINATGASVEALKVDAGAVVFDETLTVTGAATFSSTISFKDLTEVVTEANTIAASESGSVFFLDSATEFDSVLPAPAAGLHFTFIVKTAPSGANYTITTNSAANIIKGTVHASDGADGDSETSGCDTINFVSAAAVAGDMVELWCDGTNWFAKAFCDVSTGITYTTVA